MSPRKRIATADDPQRALLKGIAMDIGKEVVAYIERMYPQAVSAASSTFRLAVRNCVHNEIVGMIDATRDFDDAKIIAYLAERRIARRKLKAQCALLRETDWEAYRAKCAATKDERK